MGITSRISKYFPFAFTWGLHYIAQFVNWEMVGFMVSDMTCHRQFQLRYHPVPQMTTSSYHRFSAKHFKKTLTNYIFSKSLVIEDYKNVFR